MVTAHAIPLSALFFFTFEENLIGNLFHFFFAGFFFFIIIVATIHDLRSQSKKIIYIVYKFSKEFVALKSDGKFGDFFAKIQQATADAGE